MDDLTQAFADRLEPELAQFEANAALWRLDAHRHISRLVEEHAIGLDNPDAREAATIALEGVTFEIDRLQAFARNHQGLREGMVLRLAESAVELETARRRLQRALVEPGTRDEREVAALP